MAASMSASTMSSSGSTVPKQCSILDAIDAPTRIHSIICRAQTIAVIVEQVIDERVVGEGATTGWETFQKHLIYFQNKIVKCKLKTWKLMRTNYRRG